MPELPEVETMCRGIQFAVGRRISSVSTPPCRCRPITIKPGVAKIDQRLRGCVITRVRRLGKRVLVETQRWVLVLQPKMTGLVALDQVPDPDHVRLCILLRGRPKLQIHFWDRRGLGTVQLLAQSEIQRELIDNRLGLDALVISPDELRQRLSKTARPIKVALQDQKLLAGVGNLYASEILHLAKIHPATPSNQLNQRQSLRLHRCLLDILLTAISHEGSTLSDGTYRNALNNAGSYQNQHRVYDRAGSVCRTCQKGTVERIVQAQRATFFCPRCQKLKPVKR